MIHRADDAYIRFLHSTGQGGLRLLQSTAQDPYCRSGSVKAEHIDQVLARYEAQVDQDAYFSVNGYFRPGTHETSDLRRLNACYADLDHRFTLSFPEAVHQIMDLQENGDIPPASIISRSGTGSWLFWLLHDEDSDLPPRAWPEKIDIYRGIMQSIHNRIRDLAPALQADPKALDPSRITRIPGSLHSGASRRVHYMQQHDEAGAVFRYTLDELAEIFGVDLQPDKTKQRDPARRRVPKRINGLRALAAQRLAEFWLLFDHRGGLQGPPVTKPGCRYYGALILVKLLRDSGYPPEKVQHEVRSMARQCQPPLSGREVVKALSATPLKISNAKLCSWLQVSSEEAALLGLNHLRPDKPVKKWEPGKRDRLQLRRALLRQLHQRLPADHNPTVPTLQSILGSMGPVASLRTVHRDALSVGFTFVR